MPEAGADASRKRDDIRAMIAWIDRMVAPWHGPVLAFAAIVYVVFAILHELATPPSVASVMIPLALGTAITCTVLGLALDRIATAFRNRIFFLIAGLIWLNSAVHLALDPQAHHATNLAVAILACAIFLIRIEEFAIAAIACAAAFMMPAALAPAGQDWMHFGVHLFECMAVATVLFFMKRSICLTAHRAQTAETALRIAAEANAMRAEQASNAKSMFLANMSHELRTPLSAIIGFSDILRTSALPPAKVQDYAGHVHKSGHFLLDLINQVLDLAQGDAALVETTFDFAGFWDTIALECREMAEARSIRMDVSPALFGVQVTGDPRRIKAAIAQLAANGVKFTPALGSVSLSARLLKSGDLEITVEDDGIGIRPEDLERAFEPFYQAESDYAKRYQGMGLGLALVRQYARAHGGDATLSSVFGHGATARLRLPASRVAIRENPALLAAAS